MVAPVTVEPVMLYATKVMLLPVMLLLLITSKSAEFEDGVVVVPPAISVTVPVVAFAAIGALMVKAAGEVVLTLTALLAEVAVIPLTELTVSTDRPLPLSA